MKLHILSDLHLEFGYMVPPLLEVDAVILAGDIHKGIDGIKWAKESFGNIPVIYIAGNHEFYGNNHPKLMEKIQKECEGTNVHFLENQEFHIGDVRFLGCTLWTDYAILGDAQKGREIAAEAMNDYKRIRYGSHYRKFSPVDATKTHIHSRNWLEKSLSSNNVATVVITHHAPSIRSLAKQRSNLDMAYASNMEELLSKYKPLLWVHGHIHEKADYWIEQTRIVSNPRGYGKIEVEGFSENFIIELPKKIIKA